MTAHIMWLPEEVTLPPSGDLDDMYDGLRTFYPGNVDVDCFSMLKPYCVELSEVTEAMREYQRSGGRTAKPWPKP